MNCVGSWSTCDADCETQWTVLQPRANGGAPCAFADGQTERCTPDVALLPAAGCPRPPSPRVDCVGSWSECGADCANRWFAVATAATGGGSECEAASGDIASCLPGDGLCRQQFHSSCRGSWASCTTACESASQRLWVQITPQTGDGLPCPPAVSCRAEEGSCTHPDRWVGPSDQDCVAGWEACTEACEGASARIWAIDIPQQGRGAPW